MPAGPRPTPEPQPPRAQPGGESAPAAGAARAGTGRGPAQHPWPGYAVRVVDLVPTGDGAYLPVVALEPPR